MFSMEGRVISVNYTLCSLRLDNDVIVYAGLWAINNKNIVPNVGEDIAFKIYHQNPHDYFIVLCRHSDLVCVGQSKANNKFLSLIKRYNIGIADVMFIHNLYMKVNDELSEICLTSSEEIVLGIVEKIISSKPTCDCDCTSITLEEFMLRHISENRFINRTNESYKKFPPWTFGVHPMNNIGLAIPEYLIGFLSIDKKLGITFLRDGRYAIKCILLNVTSIGDLIFKFVIIKQGYTFTEIFSEPGVAPTEVIVFDIANAIFLDCVTKTQSTLVVSKAIVNKRLSMVFNLISKGPIIIDYQFRTQCCLIAQNEECKKFLLVLNKDLTHKIPLLRNNRKYRISSDEPLQPYKSSIFQKLLSLPTYILCSINTEFTDCGATGTGEEILNVEQAKQQIQLGRTTSLSLMGRIASKDFCYKLDSCYHRNAINVEGFGTPGQKTHRLHIMSDDGREQIHLYLNNFEQHQTPYGLLPDMIVIVRNVLAQSKKYLKCTVLTTFEIRSYEPKANFSTVNLHKDRAWQLHITNYWKLNETELPESAIVTAKLTHIKLSKANIRSLCVACKRLTHHCACKIKEVSFEVDLALSSATAGGRHFNISGNSLNLLQAILEMNRGQFKAILDFFPLMGEFQYRSPSNLVSAPISHIEVLRCMLERKLRFTSTRIYNISVDVRKGITNHQHETPKWIAVDIV